MSVKWRQASLGETSGDYSLSGLGEIQTASCNMAEQCHRRLIVYAHRLNRDIYEQPCFLEAVKLLAIRHPNTRIQILIADIEQMRVSGHRLLDLGRKLSSSIEMRVRTEQFAHDLRSFMLADDCGFLLRPIWYDLNNASLSFRDRYRVKNLAEEFLTIWEQSELDPALRQLNI